MDTEQRQSEDEELDDEVLVWPFMIGGAIAAVGYLLSLLVWFAGQLSGLMTGRGWPGSGPGDAPAVAFRFLRRPSDPGAAWPDGAAADVGPGWLIVLLSLFLCLPLGYLAFHAVRFGLNWRRRREFRLFRLGFASGREVRRVLSADTVRRKAKSVRPSMAGKRNINPREVGFYIGQDVRSREKLYSSVEDVFIILAPPRQGKDVHFCAPFTIDAPGPCIVTSTRADAFSNTYAMRAEMGRVHVFDPNGLTHWPEKLRWSPINGCENPLTAANRAASFINSAGFDVSGETAYWVSVSIMILRCYLHAAAQSGKTMRDIVRWSVQPSNPEPVKLLRKGELEGVGAPGWAGQLESCVATEPRMRSAMWAFVVQALNCFSDPAVLDACSPTAAEEFDLEEFLSGRNTLYILGKEQKNGSVAPVVTTMMEDLFDGARKIAAAKPSSRMDPPLTVELNEVAHIAPMPNLPAYMGDSGGFSIALHVYLQSLSQARARWGDNEAMIMWDNAAVRIIMGGAGNVEDLEDISRLMGEYREKKKTRTRGTGGRSEAVHKEPRRVLSPEEVRTLEFGKAVVVARAARPVEADLTPWWKRKDAAAIASGKKRTEALIRQYSATRESPEITAAFEWKQA